jgi:hypothetical protein
MSVSDEYSRRLKSREANVARLASLYERIGNVRLVVGVLALFAAGAVLFARAFAPTWLLVPIGVFIVLVL